jgi:hypothetical protein
VRFIIPPDHTITLDRLGVCKLLEAIRIGKRTKTDLGMNYGRVRYDIEAGGAEHDSTIHSPGSTLAVRGTIFNLTDEGGFPPVAVSLSGPVKFTDSAGNVETFGGAAGKAVIISGTQGAANTALNTTYVDPTSSTGRTTDEKQAVLTLPVTGLASTTTPISHSTGSGGQSGPPTPPPPPPPPPESHSLIFQLVWVASGPKDITPDLDLFILTPRGERLCPKDCPPTVPSGGRSPQDDRGGANVSLAQEIASFPDRFDTGAYQFGVKHASGAPAAFQLGVFRDGKLIGEESLAGDVSTDNDEARFGLNVTDNGAAITAPGKKRPARASAIKQPPPSKEPPHGQTHPRIPQDRR